MYWVAMLAATSNPCASASEGPLSDEDVKGYFASRSVAIMSAGKQGDNSFLEVAVSSDAKFVRQAHVYQTFKGPEGFLDFATWIETKYYIWRHDRSEVPIHPSTYCGPQVVEIEFLSADRTYGTSIEFEFDKGMLIGATSSGHKFTEGLVEQ